MPNSQFPHIPLLLKEKGIAKLTGGGKKNKLVAHNRLNRSQHAIHLKGKLNAFFANATRYIEDRKKEGLPQIKGGSSFILQIPDEDDAVIDFIAEKLEIEVVAEYDDGFLIVATEDLQLSKVKALADEFTNKARGSGRMANIFDIDEDPQSEKRIQRILEGDLFGQWPFEDSKEYVLDVSIEVAAFGKPKRPTINSRTRPETKTRKEREYKAAYIAYCQKWDDKRISREEEIEAFVEHYNGQIFEITDDSHIVEFPDSFSARIKMSGKGFKDFIFNYPNLFEVSQPDDFEQSEADSNEEAADDSDFTLLSPEAGSPTICVIDSGIQENHRWLSGAIDTKSSRCFIPEDASDDIADYVDNGGHGTSVAGACLYPDGIPREGELQSPFWIQNARVLDHNCDLKESIPPAKLATEVVTHFRKLSDTRIFQHSISSSTPCQTSRMSVWATAVDLLSFEQDALFIQAAGNLPTRGRTTNNPGISDHLTANKSYPDFLYDNSSRVSNPAQSLQALTVGSVNPSYFETDSRNSLSQAHHPSSFSRSGFGLWDTIKPELVEYGGEFARDSGAFPALTNHSEISPELIRSTSNGGPPFAKDRVGTSYSAPKVANIVGQVASLFPEASTQLYRALVVNSARWPSWAEEAPIDHRPEIIRSIGYGIPSLERATRNDENRITLVVEDQHRIRAKEGYVFAVPIPSELRRPGESYKVRIDVTLAYSPNPRRTRKSRRGYQNVWIDWRACKKNEPLETFKSRILKTDLSQDDDDEDNFQWTLGYRKKRNGLTDGVTRNNGTVQKDWTYADSFELPEAFGIVVHGHEGWDRKNPESDVPFSLVVSFEAIGVDVELYERIQASVEAEVENQQQIEI